MTAPTPGRTPRSWGRWPQHAHRLAALRWRTDTLHLDGHSHYLPWGQGRSYGDVCQNDGGTLLQTRGLDRFIAFDPDTGVLACEAGVLLREIVALALPRGWFLPVTPGTAEVTVGGAIANDVHGKNHHREGSFGRHVLDFELLRSDGQRLHCSPASHPDWFGASIGGLGLTGLILQARLQLRRVQGPFLRGKSLRFGGLSEFFALSRESNRTHEYMVAWVDGAARGKSLGRGLFMRANHADEAVGDDRKRGIAPSLPPGLRVPFTPPLSLVGKWSVAAFNSLYFHRPSAAREQARWHYRPFFYPLDAIGHWNRLYGPGGLLQYQCVIPLCTAEDALREMLARLSYRGATSALSVLKVFGELPSPGWLSFPRPGATLAIDLPHHGQRTLALLDDLDRITLAAEGAVYPAKDARMSGTAFRRFFPRWESFAAMIDPRFSSSFWRRVTDTSRT